MVYESDFYTVRRPYARPTITSYSVTGCRPIITLRNHIAPLGTHSKVRMSVLLGELNRIQHRPRQHLGYIPTEEFLNSRPLVDFDDETKIIRAQADRLLRYVYTRVPHRERHFPVGVLSAYDHYVPERRYTTQKYSTYHRDIPTNILNMSYYYEPSRVSIGRGHLACVSYAGGRGYPKRKHLYSDENRDISDEIKFRSYYNKNVNPKRTAEALLLPTGFASRLLLTDRNMYESREDHRPILFTSIIKKAGSGGVKDKKNEKTVEKPKKSYSKKLSDESNNSIPPLKKLRDIESEITTKSDISLEASVPYVKPSEPPSEEVECSATIYVKEVEVPDDTEPSPTIKEAEKPAKKSKKEDKKKDVPKAEKEEIVFKKEEPIQEPIPEPTIIGENIQPQAEEPVDPLISENVPCEQVDFKESIIDDIKPTIEHDIIEQDSQPEEMKVEESKIKEEAIEEIKEAMVVDEEIGKQQPEEIPVAEEGNIDSQISNDPIPTNNNETALQENTEINEQEKVELNQQENVEIIEQEKDEIKQQQKDEINEQKNVETSQQELVEVNQGNNNEVETVKIQREDEQDSQVLDSETVVEDPSQEAIIPETTTNEEPILTSDGEIHGVEEVKEQAQIINDSQELKVSEDSEDNVDKITSQEKQPNVDSVIDVTDIQSTENESINEVEPVIEEPQSPEVIGESEAFETN